MKTLVGLQLAIRAKFLLLFFGTLALGHDCPYQQCDCLSFNASHLSNRSTHPWKIYDYILHYGWEEGRSAIICQGRQTIPEILPEKSEIDYLVLEGTGQATNDDGGHATGQISHFSRNSFDKLRGLLYLNLGFNDLPHLDGIAFSNLNRLEVLQIYNNRLERIASNTFRYLINLVELDLSSNRIAEIEENGFSGLTNLKSLDISDNNLKMLQPTVFYWLFSLETLNLSKNGILLLQDTLFIDLISLRELCIDENALAPFTYRTLYGLFSLEKLSLFGNNLEEITPYSFFYLSGLVEIDLSHNQMSALMKRGYTFSGTESLRKLDLSFNKIEDTEPYSFKELYSLNELKLNHNKIAIVVSQTFSGLGDLKILDLSWNFISLIYSNSFTDLVKLKTLILSHNSLVSIQRGLFDGLRELETLSLDNNFIETIGDGSFRVEAFSLNSKITHLDFQNNKLRFLTPFSLNGLSNVKILNIGHNPISSIHQLSFQRMINLRTILLNNNKLAELFSGTFFYTRSLNLLDLAHNQIRILQDGFFTGLVRVKEVYLEFNQIEYIEPKHLYELSELEILKLDNNNLTKVTQEFFTDLESLKELTLSNNSLVEVTLPKTIARSNHSQIRKLTRLDISSNRLERINGNPANVLTAEAKIGLNNNPWRCDCRLRPMYQLFNYSKQLEGVENIFCHRPSFVKGKKLSDLSEIDLGCQTNLQSKMYEGNLHQHITQSCSEKNKFRRPIGEGYWPWHALIFDTKTESSVCNGALIGSSWIVTVEKCMQSYIHPNNASGSIINAPPTLFVKLGKSRNLQTFEKHEIIYRVSRIHLHPDSGAGSPVMLELRSLIDFNEFVHPICLAEAMPADGSKLVETRWKKGGKKQGNVEKLKPSRMELRNCSQLNLAVEENSSTVCASSQRKNKNEPSSSVSSTGALLVVRNKKYSWKLLGIKKEESDNYDTYINMCHDEWIRSYYFL